MLPLEQLHNFLERAQKIRIVEKYRTVTRTGYLKGFDEYFNLVFVDERNVSVLMKGDSVCAVLSVDNDGEH